MSLPHLTTSYNDNVFINCPFDATYQKIFYAATYTILRCGFIPHSALEHDDGSENRIDKLYRLIEHCRYGIHDISNAGLDKESGLPRFNMPFELGVFLAAKRFGDEKQKTKNAIIFEENKYQSKIYLSDISGVDPKAHSTDHKIVIKHIRQWLSTSSRRSLPGYINIQKEFDDFYVSSLPLLLQKSALDMESLSFNDYCLLVEEWINPKA